MFTESKFARVFRILVCSWLFGGSFGTLQSPEVCVLSLKGKHVCAERNDISVSLLDRSIEICSRDDEECWCMKAVDYTNDVRRRHGKTKMLKPGPMSQLKNAKRYALALGKIGRLEHQDLAVASKDVKCSRMIYGENIAYNYENADIALSCVQQWEASQGHLQNILRENIDEVVVGFYRDANGRVYCVQTFSAINGVMAPETGTDSKCNRVGDSNGESTHEDNIVKAEQETGESTHEDNIVKAEQETGIIIGNETGNHNKGERAVEPVENQNTPIAENNSGHIENTKPEVEQNLYEEERNKTDTVNSEEIVKDETGYANDLPIIDNEKHMNAEALPGTAESELSYAPVEDNKRTDSREEIYAQNAVNEAGNEMGAVQLEESVPNEDGYEETMQNEDNGYDGADTDAAEDLEHTLPENLNTEKVPSHQDMEAKHKNGRRSKRKSSIDDNNTEESVGNRACRCLEVGKRCWHSLGKLTAHACTPSLPTKKQPTSCKLKCCSYCLTKPKSRRCTNKVVKRLCKKLSKIIEKNL